MGFYLWTRSLVLRALARSPVVATTALLFALGVSGCVVAANSDKADDDVSEVTGLQEQALGLGACGPTGGTQSGAVWPTRGGCATRGTTSTEFGPEVAAEGDIPPLNWSANLGGDVRSGVVVDKSGFIYVGSDANRFVKIDPVKGTVLKTFATGGAVRGTALIRNDGTLLVPSLDKKLYALDPANLTQKWAYTAGGAISSSPAVAGDGTIFVGSDDKLLHAVTPAGTRKWASPTGARIGSSPALSLDDKLVFATSDDKSLYAFNTSDGSLKWKKSFGVALGSPLVGRFSNVYVPIGTDLVAFDVSSGTQAWSLSMAPCTVTTLAASKSGTLYVGTDCSGTWQTHGVRAVDPSGAQLWFTTTTGAVRNTPIVDALERVYFGDDGGYVRAYSNGGQRMWAYQATGFIESSPALGADGQVLVGTNSDRLYSIGVANPRVGKGAQCSGDADCLPGYVCGDNNGDRFGRPGTNACVVPACQDKVLEPGETKVDCGNVCGTCTGLCAADCTLGEPITPTTPNTMGFAGGTFSRTSYATYESVPGTLEVVDWNVLRYEDHRDGNGRVALFEGPRTNRVTFSERLDRVESWGCSHSAPCTGQASAADAGDEVSTAAIKLPSDPPPTCQVLGPCSGVTADQAIAPDGTTTAELLNLGAFPQLPPVQTIGSPVQAGNLSMWLSAANAPTLAGKTRTRLFDSQNNVSFTSDPALDVGKAWKRYVIPTAALPTTTPYANLSWSQSAVGSLPSLGAFTFYGWGVQLEEGAFPTSYIRTADTPVTRQTDRLVFDANSVSAWLRANQWQLDVLPLHASKEIAIGDEFVIMAWEGGALSLGKDANGGLLRIVTTAGTTTHPMEWERDTRIRLTLDNTSHTIDIAGATAGSGQLVYPQSPVATGKVSIGAMLDGTKSAFARISEPRQVYSLFGRCSPDHDCVRCGDGQVTGAEHCDYISDPTCNNKTCADNPGLVECASDADCGLGQSCPTTANGEGFGAGSTRSFCVATYLCGDARPVCGSGGNEQACGSCTHLPNCATKKCGDAPDDGEGGTCTGFCNPGQAGAKQDSDCPPGYIVGHNEGWRFGLNPKANVCWPAFCEDIDPRRIDCGTPSSPCGVCDADVADDCFKGALCDKPKGASCAAGTHGNEIGVCVPDGAAPVADDVPTNALSALPGGADVTPSGSATYTIPIDVPPGRGGLTPSLTLSYASSSGNGAAGLDWSVTGLSTISVCNQTFAQDGYLRDYSAGLCLDGQRLVRIGFANNQTEWRTEFESFTRIFSPGDFTKPDANGDITPTTFTAYRSDGTVLTYGTADKESAQVNGLVMAMGGSLSTRTWALSSIRDRAGNSISIKYSKFHTSTDHFLFDGELLPRWIGYNFVGKKDGDAVNEIVFAYQGEGEHVSGACHSVGSNTTVCAGSRPDEMHGYSFGHRVAQTRLLGEITILAQGKTVRRYQLKHETSDNRLSMLRQVTECAVSADGKDTCRVPTTFDYEPGMLGLTSSAAAPGAQPAQWLSLDWNGDGYDDAALYDGHKWNVYRGGPSGLATTSTDSFQSAKENDRTENDHQVQDALVTDFDLDGRPDVLLASKDESNVFAIDRVENGAARTRLPIAWRSGYPRKNGTFLVWDPDGDGFSDILYCTGDDKEWLNFTNVKGTITDGAGAGVGAYGFCDDSAVVTLQDGRDILVYNDGSGYQSLGIWQVGNDFIYPTSVGAGANGVTDKMQLQAALDLNGDGLQDLLFRSRDHSSSYFEVWSNTGTTTNLGKWDFGTNGYDSRIRDADFVGGADYDLDGRGDLLLANYDGSKTTWWVYRGADLAAAPVTIASFPGKVALPVVLDANGDGRSDYAGAGKQFFGNSPIANLLKKVTIPSHSTDVPQDVVFTYASGVAPGAYAAGNGADCDGAGLKGVCLRKLPGPVVQTMETHLYKQDRATPDIVQSAKAAYAYTDARVDVHGRGFIGFRQRTLQTTGVGGENPVLNVESYDLSVKDEGKSGPFSADFNVDPSYHYYYYPFAGIPKQGLVAVTLPNNAITRSDTMIATQKMTRTFEMRQSDAGLRYMVLTAEDHETREAGAVLDQVHIERTYDSYGNVKSSTTTWPLEDGYSEGLAYYYVYENDASRVAQFQTDLVGTVQTLSYAPVDNAQVGISRTTRYTYTPEGLVSTVIEKLEGRGTLVTALGRDERNNVSHVEQYGHDAAYGDTPHRIWQTTYDSLAGVYPYEMQNPEGHPTQVLTSYADGRARSYINANNEKETWKYDGFGLLVEHRLVTQGPVTTYSYSPAGFEGSQILGRNATSKVSLLTVDANNQLKVSSDRWYDQAGRLVATRSAGFESGANVYSEYLYDSFGRISEASRPHLEGNRLQGYIKYGYDGLGRPISVESADHKVSRTYYASKATTNLAFARGDARYVVASDTPKGKRSYAYSDGRGHMVQTADPIAKMDYVYGPAGFLLTTTDKLGNKIQRTFDTLGRVQTVTDPDTGTHSYAYTPFGEISQYVDNTEPHFFQYDDLGRVIAQGDSDGVTSWTWDKLQVGQATLVRNGALMQATSPAGHVDTYSYNGPGGALDRVQRRVIGQNGPIDLAASFTYDGLARPETITYPGASSFKVKYQYSPAGFLQSVVNVADPNEKFWTLTQTHQGFRPARELLGNGTTISTTFDEQTGRINFLATNAKQAGAPDLLKYGLTYDDNGNVGSVQRYHDLSETAPTTYQYDDGDRLQFVKRGSGDSAPVLASFTHTDTGNLKTKSGFGTYSYGLTTEPESGPQTMPHFVRTVTSQTGTHKYVPDPFGRMQSREGPTVPQGWQGFTYTAQGQLKRVTNGGPNGPWTEFGYSASGERVLETTSDGSQNVRFSGLYEQVFPKTGSPSEVFRVLVGGRAVAEISRAGDGTRQLSYLHRNHLGSVELITKQDGSELERRNYGAFGETEDIAASEIAIGFTGHRQEAAIGLVDMVGRFYDANLGRFITPDPTIPAPGFSQAYNRYSYVYNNPLSLIDPSGYGPTDFTGGPNPSEGDPTVPNNSGNGGLHVDGKKAGIGGAVVLGAVGLAAIITRGVRKEWFDGKVKGFFKSWVPDAFKTAGGGIATAAKATWGAVETAAGAVKNFFTGGDDKKPHYDPQGQGRAASGGGNVGNGTPLVSTIDVAPADADDHVLCMWTPQQCEQDAAWHTFENIHHAAFVVAKGIVASGAAHAILGAAGISYYLVGGGATTQAVSGTLGVAESTAEEVLATEAPGVVEEAAAADGAPSLAQVQINRENGNAFRDEIAEALRSEGKDVVTEVYKPTPFGKRFIDIEVSENGSVLGGIETKVGSSPYTPAQRAKDAWLYYTQGYRVDLIRQ